jgi:hypothetical protein
MKERKQDQIGGNDPWDIEIAYWLKKGGDDLDPDKARIFTILRWMYHGDFRPLAAAIHEGYALDEAILNCLARMIDEDRLTIKARQRGIPKLPNKFSRDLVAALLYESRTTTENSEDALKYVADTLGMSHQSVRQAVTRLRKANAK